LLHEEISSNIIVYLSKLINEFEERGRERRSW
jgi:hypothetical protein